jgi:flagellar hook assembly protein FlgD
VPTAIVESGTLPTTVSLGKAYPNPFNSTVQVPFALSADGDVKVDIVDVLGASVWRQTWSRLVAGDHRFTWDGLDGEGRAVATGVYYVRLQVAGGDLVTPIMLLR